MKKTAGIALVCTETCRVLFLEKAVGRTLGLWGFPGGTMDDGETYEEAMYRETEEETGIGRSSISNVRYLTDISTSKKIFKLYIGELGSELVPVLSGEHSDYAWIDLDKFDELPALDLNPVNIALLPHIRDHVECRVRDIDENYHVLKLGFRRHLR